MAEAVSRAERADRTAMWRWGVIREAIDPELTAKQRGQVVRRIAARAHPGPGGGAVTVSRETVDRWARAWRSGGLMALRPSGRQSAPRTPQEVLDMAAALKAERPERTAAQVRRVMVRACGDAPSESTLLRHFRRLGLGTAPVPEAHGRFQADFPNDRWVADALHGPRVAGRKAYLFAFVDDCSRYVVGARWACSEDHARLAIAFRPALAAHGVPKQVYVDNGACFKDRALDRACARLGIRLTHSAPARPQGRGKVERFFHTVNSQFLAEVAPAGEAGPAGGTAVSSLEELNSLFDAWLGQVYHRAPNDTTGQAPADRWKAGWARAEPRRATLEQIADAFKWSETRKVRTDATIALFGNSYQVDPSLVGRRVEVVFDPYEMGGPVQILSLDGKPAGEGAPAVIGRHVHKKAEAAARDESRGPGGGAATGIDYLRMLEQDRRDEIAAAGIGYRALSDGEAAAAAADRPDADGDEPPWEQGALL